ncbi:MAG: RNA polymerase sigma factor, RpoD/SigA family [Leptolyngbya foveolarum]|uniref:RNA polymerase sigma factor, RpoD/SigA family n=1 Tax=Leptolyngbya foveolarum TaxID=47253 RepID=A0A2W4UJJ1_9CYAN|nr:MAG: RNA polymerase sigma factor, RpoD/SigA family [Leptolyngbya foveolarum]
MKNNSQSSNLVRSYLKNIGRIPLLTHEQEITLGKRVQQYMELEEIKSDLAETLGDAPTPVAWAGKTELSTEELKRTVAAGKSARAKMVESNLRLVVSIAKKYTGNSLDMMDLIQEGTIGLHRGVEKFDPSKGYRFSTYAYWWIRQAITRAIGNSSRVIRLPIHISDKLRKIRKSQRQLSQALGRPATVSEVAADMSLSVEKLREIQTQGRRPLSLDMKVGNEQSTDLGSLLEDEGILPEEYATHSLLKSDIQKLLQTLNEQQQKVIGMRFGLETGSKMTLNQIGESMDISRERVRQVERAALRKLRQRSAPLKEYATAS